MPPIKTQCDHHLDLVQQLTKQEGQIGTLEEITDELKDTVWGNGKDGLKTDFLRFQYWKKDMEKWLNRIWVIVSGLGVIVALVLIKQWIG